MCNTSHTAVTRMCTARRVLACLLLPAAIFLIITLVLMFWDIGKYQVCNQDPLFVCVCVWSRGISLRVVLQVCPQHVVTGQSSSQNSTNISFSIEKALTFILSSLLLTTTVLEAFWENTTPHRQHWASSIQKSPSYSYHLFMIGW